MLSSLIPRPSLDLGLRPPPGPGADINGVGKLPMLHGKALTGWSQSVAEFHDKKPQEIAPARSTYLLSGDHWLSGKEDWPGWQRK